MMLIGFLYTMDSPSALRVCFTLYELLAGQMGISSFSVVVAAITDKTYVLYLSTNKIGTQAIGIHVVKHSDETVEVIPFGAQYNSDKGKYTLTFSPPLDNGDVVVSFFSVI